MEPNLDYQHWQVNMHRSVSLPCIGEKFLSSDIKKLETVVACSYCKKGNVIGCTLCTFANRVDTAFEQHYVRVSEHVPDDWPLEWIKRLGPEWEPPGNRVVEAIAQAAKIKIKIARDVRVLLEERHYSRSAEEIGETTDFNRGSYYAVNDVNDAEWHKKWDQFEQILKTQTRFFSKKAAQHLNDVFGHLESLNSFDHRPVVRTIGPGTSLLSISGEGVSIQYKAGTGTGIAGYRTRPAATLTRKGWKDECQRDFCLLWGNTTRNRSCRNTTSCGIYCTCGKVRNPA